MTSLPPVKRGDTWNFKFVWAYGEEPLDLTDCTARMQVRAKRTGVLLAAVTSIDGDIIISGLTGTVDVAFPASMTADVIPGIHDTDLEITFPVTGQVKSCDTLRLIVKEDITR